MRSRKILRWQHWLREIRTRKKMLEILMRIFRKADEKCIFMRHVNRKITALTFCKYFMLAFENIIYCLFGISHPSVVESEDNWNCNLFFFIRKTLLMKSSTGRSGAPISQIIKKKRIFSSMSSSCQWASQNPGQNSKICIPGVFFIVLRRIFRKTVTSFVYCPACAINTDWSPAAAEKL